MNNLFFTFLSLSISGSIVALALFGLKPFVRRLGRTWQYYIWLLVILRLLLPFGPETGVVGGLFQKAETHLTVKNGAADIVPDGNVFQTPRSLTSFGKDIEFMQKSSDTAAVSSFMNSRLLSVVWLTVASLMLTGRIYSYLRFLRRVKRESTEIPGGRLPLAVRTISAAMGIRRKITVCTNSLVRAPMLAGVIQPMIIVPAEDIPQAELTLILRHELTHYRRMDFLYKWLTETALCLHWFNPLIRLVRRQINRDCEFSCDEAVIASCTEYRQRQIYGEALLNSIVPHPQKGWDGLSLFLNKDGKLIKERLDSIMQYHRKSRLTVFAAAALTAILFSCTVYAGSYTAAAAENRKSVSADGPIRISNKSIAAGGKISPGSQLLFSGTKCHVLLNWTGGDTLAVLCTSADGETEAFPVNKARLSVFDIQTDGEYTIAVKNTGSGKVSDVNGTIEFKTDGVQPDSSSPPAVASAEAVVYEAVELRHYDNVYPYIHNTRTNLTKKDIIGFQRGMLAFDQDGNPLQIDWWWADTDIKKTFFYLYEEGPAVDDTDEPPNSLIAAGETYDVYGGWSLDETDPASKKAVWFLYCDKEITFRDGTVWINPDFEKWRAAYEGKKTDVNVLKSYYPYVQEITAEE